MIDEVDCIMFIVVLTTLDDRQSMSKKMFTFKQILSGAGPVTRTSEFVWFLSNKI